MAGTKRIGPVAAVAALCLAAAFAAGIAPAQAAGGTRARLDANGDGFVDRAEVTARGDAAFDALDKDRDGSLSREELATGGRRAKTAAGVGARAVAQTDEERREARAAKRFARLDGDRDGRVSRDEFRASRLGAFERRDKDADGKLSPEERPRVRARG